MMITRTNIINFAWISCNLVIKTEKRAETHSEQQIERQSTPELAKSRS